MAPSALRHLEGELRELEATGLLRSAATIGAGYLGLSSNDYLGYARRSIAGSEEAGGSGSSRLVSGDTAAHREAERELAAWVGTESALLFSSGYAANIGLLSALAREGDVIISDALNHASLIDGCRLSRARVIVVPHLDLSALESALQGARGAPRRWVVTESYFSMDADSPDLRALRELCDSYDAALIVDEAHALGVFGPRGAGLCAEAGVRPDALVGTLGKALGLQGAFVAGSEALRAWLWNRARSFVFSTGLSPTLAVAASRRVLEIQTDEVARSRLFSVAGRLRDALSERQATAAGYGPIVPWMVGTPANALDLSRSLLEQGIFIPAIRPPTVPPGSSRLRITASAAITDEELERALRAIEAAH
jgi:8-amino-7-oxononanoate synthase